MPADLQMKQSLGVWDRGWGGNRKWFNRGQEQSIKVKPLWWGHEADKCKSVWSNVLVSSPPWMKQAPKSKHRTSCLCLFNAVIMQVNLTSQGLTVYRNSRGFQKIRYGEEGLIKLPLAPVLKAYKSSAGMSTLLMWMASPFQSKLRS